MKQRQQQQQELFVDFRKPFVVSSRILRVLGLWSESPESFFGLNFYTAYAVSVMAACTLLYAAEVAFWVFVRSDFETIANSGVLVFEELQTNVKVFCIIKHQPMVKRLLRECNKEMFQPRTGLQARRAEEVLSVYKWFYVAFGVSAFCSSSALSFNSLIGKRGQEVLPYLAWYPYNHTLHFWPTYCHQVLGTLVSAQTHVNVDCFSIGLLAFIVVQCDILADSIRNSKAIARSLLEASGRSNPVVDQTELMLETEKQFYALIRHHKEILRWFQEIHRMLDPIIFAQYAASAISLCMTLIQASMVEPTDPKFASMVMYAGVILGQLFMFCWWGNELIDKSSRISVAAFESDWPEMSRKAKKDVLTFAHCTQAPLELFALNYFRVSLQTYMLILRHSYSFFAVLHRMNT